MGPAHSLASNNRKLGSGHCCWKFSGNFEKERGINKNSSSAALAFGGKANEMTFSGRHVSLPCLRIICSVVLIILTAERAVSIRFPDRISESVKASSNQPLKTAVFALGSFWRSEAVFGCLDGVVRTTAGYAGGSKANPEYRSWGDHAESVQV